MSDDAIIEQAWTEFRDSKGVKAGGLVYVAFKKSVTAALTAVREECAKECERYMTSSIAPDGYDALHNEICRNIAKRIRTSTEAP